MSEEKVFVIWRDYNGTNIEEFISAEAAERRLDRLQGYVDENKEDYGAEILKVIRGTEMVVDVIELAKKTRLRFP